MKMYSKKLHSLKELKREKHELKNRINRLKSSGTHNEREPETNTGSDIFSMLGGFIAPGIFSEVILKTVFSLLGAAGRKAKKRTVNPLVKEVAGGYLKWKILELGYRWLRRYMNKKKKAKNQPNGKTKAKI